MTHDFVGIPKGFTSVMNTVPDADGNVLVRYEIDRQWTEPELIPQAQLELAAEILAAYNRERAALEQPHQ